MEEKLDNLYEAYNNWYESNNQDNHMHIVFKRVNNKYEVKINSLDYQNNFNYHNILSSFKLTDKITKNDYLKMVLVFINSFILDNYYLQDCKLFEYRKKQISRLVLKLVEQKDGANFYSIFEFVDNVEVNAMLKENISQIIADYDYRKAHNLYNSLVKLNEESLLDYLNKDDLVEAVIKKELKK